MKKLTALLLAVLMICCLLPTAAWAAPIATGECGDNVSWEIDKTGTLILRGSGGMDNYLGCRTDSEEANAEETDGEESDAEAENPIRVTHRQGNLVDGYAPWMEKATSIRRIVVEDGVTNIGEGAFCGLERVASVSLPPSIYEVSEYAFRGCSLLIAVSLPEEIVSIGAFAFADCTKLQEVIMPTSLEEIGEGAFLNTAIKSAHLPKSLKRIEKFAFGYRFSKFYYAASAEEWAKVKLAEEGIVLSSNKKPNLRYRVVFDAGEGTINYLLDKYNIVQPNVFLETPEKVYASTSKKHGIYLRGAPSKDVKYQNTLLDEGSYFTVYARKPGYCLIVDESTGLPGWVSAEYVKFEEDNMPLIPEEGPCDRFLEPYEGAIQAPDKWESKYVYRSIATSAKLGLYLRLTPSYDWDQVFGMAPEYSKVIILAYSADGEFDLIYDLTTGQLGWVTAKFLR